MAEEVAALSVRLEATAARFERDMQRATRSMDGAARRMERRADGLDRRLARVGDRFGIAIPTRAIAAAAAIAAMSKAISDVVRNGDRLKLLEGRFKALTGSGQRATESIARVFDIAERTGAPLESVGSAMARLTLAASDLGRTDVEVARLTETILKLAQIGGSTTQELQGGSIQLAQALASGKLSGDELRSVLENLPLVARQIADGLGVGVGQLREMGKEGKLTADVVFGALLKGADDVDRKFSELPVTVSRAANNMATAWSRFTAELDDSIGLGNALADVMDRVARATTGAANALATREAKRQIALSSEIQEIRAELAAGGMMSRGREAALRRALSEKEAQLQGILEAEALPVRRSLADQIAPALPEIGSEVKLDRPETEGGPKSSPVPARPPMDLGVPEPTRTRRGGGGSRGASPLEKANSLAVDMIEQVTERIRLLEDERAVTKGLTEMRARLSASGMDEAQIDAALNREQSRLNASFERARIVRELETRAAREGLEISPQQRAEIEALAAEYETLTVAIYDETAALEAANEAAEEAKRKQEEASKAVADLGDRFSRAIQSADSFADALKNVAIELANLVAQAIAGEGPLAALFGGDRGGGGGILGALGQAIAGGSLGYIGRPQAPINMGNLGFAAGADARFMHSGGVVGTGGITRKVNPAVFAGAPRMHSGGIVGLKPDEVPIIGQRGELMIPRGAKAGRGGDSITINQPITVNGSGMPAEQVARLVEGRVRQANTEVVATIRTRAARDPSFIPGT